MNLAPITGLTSWVYLLQETWRLQPKELRKAANVGIWMVRGE